MRINTCAESKIVLRRKNMSFKNPNLFIFIKICEINILQITACFINFEWNKSRQILNKNFISIASNSEDAFRYKVAYFS